MGVIMMGLMSCGETEKVVLSTACDANYCHGQEVTYVLPPSVSGCSIAGDVITCSDNIVINVDIEVNVEDNDSIEIDVKDRDGKWKKKRCKRSRR